MESFRRVHVSYACSGKTLGIVWKKPEHEWTTFVSALHYYAARKINVPIWCVDLLWECDPWDEAQLPMNVHVKCNISSVFPEIAESIASYGRCSNCWEDCEDLDEEYELDENNESTAIDWGYLRNCHKCGTWVLCDLCKVILPGGSPRCLHCLVPLRSHIGLLRGGLIRETDARFQARVAAALAGLTEAQRKRWGFVNGNPEAAAVASALQI